MKRNEDGSVKWIRRPQSIENEAMLELRLTQTLDENGIKWDRQVKTPAGGRADVVTAWAVYEVKCVLERHDLFKAFGQVTIYAAALGRPRRVIVGYPVRGCDDIVNAIEALGVEINVVP